MPYPRTQHRHTVPRLRGKKHDISYTKRDSKPHARQAVTSAKRNEMKFFRPPLCTCRQVGEPPGDGEMTLPSRPSPAGLRPSTLPLGHGGFPQY